MDSITGLVGQKILIEGHFSFPVLVEAIKPEGELVTFQVRTNDGQLHETILTVEEATSLLQKANSTPLSTTRWSSAEELRLP